MNKNFRSTRYLYFHSHDTFRVHNLKYGGEYTYLLFYLLVRSRKCRKDIGNCAVGDCKNGYDGREYILYKHRFVYSVSDILTGVAELIFMDVKNALEYSGIIPRIVRSTFS